MQAEQQEAIDNNHNFGVQCACLQINMHNYNKNLRIYNNAP